jgi:hypothetical protein
MARLTKKDRQTLRSALAALERAADFLAREDVEVARHTGMSDTHTYRKEADGPDLYTIRKDYGSPLAGLEDARRILGEYLATH